MTGRKSRRRPWFCEALRAAAHQAACHRTRYARHGRAARDHRNPRRHTLSRTSHSYAGHCTGISRHLLCVCDCQLHRRGCCIRPVVTAAEIIRPIRSSGPVLKTTRHIPRRRVPRFRSSGPQRPPVCSPPESDRCRRSVPESPRNGFRPVPRNPSARDS